MPASDIKWAIDKMAERNEQYRVYSDYYDGNHKLLFATEKYRNAFGNLFREFADNLCPSVVDCFAQGLQVTGFDGDKASDALEMWQQCRMHRVEAQLWNSAFKEGDSYLIVWPDKNDNVRMWPQNGSMCTVQYDDDEPDRITKAAKAWRAEPDAAGKVFGRLNLYYEDRIERYETRNPIKGGGIPHRASGWQPFTAGKPNITNEYGVVPVFHFANNADLGDFGTSELKDVISLQDALNKSICDMLVAMEFQAFPQRWATGLQTEVDEDTGKPKNPPFTPGVDRIWSAPGDNVKFGEFAAGDITKYVNVQNDIRSEVCRVTGVPPYWMFLDQGEIPTGEGLKVTAGRRTVKLQRDQRAFGDVLSDAMRFGLILDGKLDDFDKDRNAVVPIWQTASPHNPLLDAETELVNEQVGVSKRRSLKNLGYSDADIDEMNDELDEEAQRTQARNPQPQVDAQGRPVNPNANQPQNRAKGGKPTANNRKGKAGQARQAAPQQQQGVKAPQPNPGQGQTQP